MESAIVNARDTGPQNEVKMIIKGTQGLSTMTKIWELEITVGLTDTNIRIRKANIERNNSSKILVVKRWFQNYHPIKAIKNWDEHI